MGRGRAALTPRPPRAARWLGRPLPRPPAPGAQHAVQGRAPRLCPPHLPAGTAGLLRWRRSLRRPQQRPSGTEGPPRRQRRLHPMQQPHAGTRRLPLPRRTLRPPQQPPAGTRGPPCQRPWAPRLAAVRSPAARQPASPASERAALQRLLWCSRQPRRAAAVPLEGPQQRLPQHRDKAAAVRLERLVCGCCGCDCSCGCGCGCRRRRRGCGCSCGRGAQRARARQPVGELGATVTVPVLEHLPNAKSDKNSPNVIPTFLHNPATVLPVQKRIL